MARRVLDSLTEAEDRHRAEIARNLHVIEQLLADRGAAEERAREQGRAEERAKSQIRDVHLIEQHQAELEKVKEEGETRGFARGLAAAREMEEEEEDGPARPTNVSPIHRRN
ncbi:hypothetical protein AB0J86_22255 [Micromonospora sp. NPDC049559]|uniref:hypothetical protein n=1 Tax=Micromonospora sp. NPDC049559 TaxID=3155923 RepID=UPI003441A18D